MDLPKQLQCLAERTSRYFGEYISPGKYQPEEEFTCRWFIAHSFDLNMLGVQKQEMLLIWFSNDSNTCAWKGYLCDVDTSIIFLFWTWHLLKFEHEPLGDGWKLFAKNFGEKIFLLCTCCRYILVFSYFFCNFFHCGILISV